MSGSNFKADTYTLAESGGPSGYNASQYSCIKNGGAPVVGNSITLGLGDSATCTINNNDNAPSLTLQKIVVKDNGGTALPSDWSLYAIMGNVGIGGTGPTVSSDSTFSAGTYILSETDPSFGYRPSDWVCEGGTQEGDQITLELGQSAICTITNNDIAPILTLIKTVVTNDGGTATEADFQAYINDDPAPWNQAQTLSVGNYTANELANVSGYTPSEWTGDCDADGNVSLAEGENKTCYITNDDIAPSLKLVKEVIKDDGGQANPVDWILTARRLCQAGDPSPSCGFSDSGDSTTFHTLTAGKLYILTESGPDGYAMGSWSCNGGSLTANRLTLGLDEEVTCTITNDDQPGSISGMKFEDEDGDGVKDAEELGLSNWTINISGPVNTSTITDASGNYTFSDLPAGIYTVTESLELGWTQTTSNPSPINLANGQIVTGVNFGNFDLVIISGKKFNDLNGDHIKDSGEPGLEGWIIMLDKVDDILSPVCVGGIIVGEFCTRTTNSSGNYSFSNLGPGTYIVSEVFKDGWTQTRPNASYGGQGAQADGTYLLIVESGDDIEDRDFGNRGNLSITACKYEDSNGTEEGGEFTPVNDWDFNLINNQLTQNTGDSNCTTFENLTPGEYSVSENPLSDGWFVADGSGGTQNITLPTDDTTLNFYNYRKGEIGGLKWNDEDGDGEKADCEWDWWELWDWDWNGFCESGLEDWIIFLDENENGVLDEGEDYAETDEDGFYTFTDLDPGTYRVCEVLQDGWEQTYPDNSELNNCHEVIVSSGEHVEDIDFGNQGRATITVYKNIDTDGDGDIDITNATDWTWDIDGEGDFVTGGDSQEVSAGDYEVSEDQKDNYHVTSVECNNEEQYEPSENIEISVEAGQNLVCTFTNTRDTGSITVIKNIDNTGDGDTDDEGDVQGVTNWTWDIIDGEQNISTGQTKTLPIGTYTASEDQQDGYKLLGWTCSNEQTGTTNSIEINVTSESETFCTFTNQLLPPVLILTKTNDKTGIDVSAGANVRYTLTVSLTGSPVSNVSVIDLPPAGFIYRLGSWTASSSVRGDLKALGITTEPTYASPGTWLLGDMIGGEVVILTYIADINSSTDPGLYKDLAWSKGTGIDSSTVLANESSGFFVGTEVNVVKSLGESTGVEIIKEERGEVLGISAELPATGINTIWVSLAALLLLGGSGLILAGISLRRRYE